MSEPIFDHERLDVYRLSIEYVATSFRVAKSLNGSLRHARDHRVDAHSADPADGERSGRINRVRVPQS